MEGATMGTQQAKLMSQGLRRLTAANKRTALIYINQTREAIGSMFGPRTITSGGKAMAFYAGARLEMVRTESIKRNVKRINHKTNTEAVVSVTIGHRVLVRVEKDKTGKAKQSDETTFVFNYELGAHDPIEDLVYLGRRHRLIRVSAKRWILTGYEDESVLGRKKFARWLARQPLVQEDLTAMIAAAHLVADEPEEQTDEGDEDE